MTPDDVKWDAQGLAPAIVQDAATGEVLTLAWMNRESLRRTLDTGLATFWSRSRNELWVKGATSGNTQAVRAVRLDCDADAILLKVDPAGPACHTGARSCFLAGEALLDAPDPPGQVLAALERVIRARQQAPPEGSYTAKLFADEALRHKKVGEEAAELVVASMRGKREEIAHEAADLIYHALVLLRAHGMGLAEVAEVLRSREGKRR
ncbi:MAG TPA: bifunctional phosphoribosyl-AMP cyclohydrolase/phosphoribosyl-ATP diphosphatase HisIE [Myxococcales bacterium]|nr:bifunctional phosphoribosyl-AMP cyclohydrolase/phosphoribosyl-ATP diphosphatase HisIE [Myxococcales bacterium]